MSRSIHITPFAWNSIKLFNMPYEQSIRWHISTVNSRYANNNSNNKCYNGGEKRTVDWQHTVQFTSAFSLFQCDPSPFNFNIRILFAYCYHWYHTQSFTSPTMRTCIILNSSRLKSTPYEKHNDLSIFISIRHLLLLEKKQEEMGYRSHSAENVYKNLFGFISLSSN